MGKVAVGEDILLNLSFADARLHNKYQDAVSNDKLVVTSEEMFEIFLWMMCGLGRQINTYIMELQVIRTRTD